MEIVRILGRIPGRRDTPAETRSRWPTSTMGVTAMGFVFCLVFVTGVEGLFEETWQGLVFPDLLTETELRSGLPSWVDAPYLAFVATREQLYLVISDEVVEKGYATVEGRKLLDVSWRGRTLKVIKASRITHRFDGDRTSIQTIRANPEKHRFTLVKLSCTLREVSFVLEPEVSPRPVTVGLVSTQPVGFGELDPFSGASLLMGGVTRQSLEELLGRRDGTIPIVGLEHGFWKDAEAEVDAVVLTPGGPVDEFLDTVLADEPGIMSLLRSEGVFLYKIKTDLHPLRLSGAKQARSGATGQIVGFDSNGFGVNVSLRNLVRDLTGGEVPVDIILNCHIAWNRAPVTREDVLLTMGASSGSQKQPFEYDSGFYRFCGEIRSGEEIHEDLSEVVGLSTFERDRLRGLSVSPPNSILDPLLDQFKSIAREVIPESPCLILFWLTTLFVAGKSSRPWQGATLSRR